MRKIILDIYGADAGEREILLGAVKTLKKYDDIYFVFAGENALIEKVMNENNIDKSRYSSIDTNKYVTNYDLPTCVFTDSDYSMVKALKYLKENDDCIGLLSPGNTGALLVGTIFHLGLIKGLKSPALSAHINTGSDKLACITDCGANVECTAKDLLNFALMGNVIAKARTGEENPKIGLLSVGREEGKGTTLTKEAFNLIKAEESLNFIGNIEGNNLLDNTADVIICDGFSGNVLLKNVEETGKTCVALIEEMTKDFTEEKEKALTDMIKEKLTNKFDLNSQGGATFLGTQKAVIKMHGIANSDTVVSCVEQLSELESNGFTKMMKELNL